MSARNSKSGPPIRAGLIGAGYIADWHADALRALPGVTLAAVCDRSRPAAEALAEAHGARVFSDAAEMLVAGACDAVHVLTPPPSHQKLALEAIAAGQHVLVEKPVALSARGAKRIENAAARAGVTYAAGHNFLGLPSYERLKRLREAGHLGRVSSAEVNWHLPLAPLRSGPFGLWLLAEPKNLLLELAPHLFAFVVDLFGPPEILHLSTGHDIALPGGYRRPQSFRILARAGGVEVTIALTLAEVADDRSVVLRGSSAVARLDYGADTLTVARENAADIVLNPALKQLSAAAQALREGGVNFVRQALSLNRAGPYALGFRGAIGAFYDAIREARPVDARFSGPSASAVMRAIDDSIAWMPAKGAETRKPPARSRKPDPEALVIGGTGFIGRHLTRALVAKGQDVRVASRGARLPFDDLPDSVEPVSVALDDEAALICAMKGVRHVYHLAKSTDNSWQAALKNEVAMTETIARAALAAGVERFVYTGTIASYDMSDPKRVITEETGFAADMSDRNIYARAKAESESRLLAMHRQDGLPLTIARPGIVIGPGGPLQHWGIGRWQGAGCLRIWGHGRNILPFVLIDDVVDALILMAQREEAVGRSFNLVGEPMLSARDYFAAIHESTGARIRPRPGWLPGFWLADGVKYALKRHVLGRRDATRASLADWRSRAHFSRFDNSLAKSLLGWQPEGDRDAFVRRGIAEAGLFGF